MIDAGTVILCALLALLFWAVITGRLRLPPEKPKGPYVWGSPESLHAQPSAWDCSELVDDAIRRSPHIHYRLPDPRFQGSPHVRIIQRRLADLSRPKPFDWSQHPDL